MQHKIFSRQTAFITAFLLVVGGTLSRSHAQESWQEKLKEIEKQFAKSAPALNTSDSKVQVSTLLSVNKVHAGSQFQAAVVLDIQDSWHINAHVPSMEFLIGTKLNFAAPEGIRIIDIRYPQARKLEFAFADEPLSVYEDSVTIFVTVKAANDISEGKHEIPGTLQVQACDDQVCLALATVDVAIPFEAVDLSQSVTPINTNIFSSVAGSSIVIPNGREAGSGHTIAEMFSDRGAVLAFLGIFVIGLALNLTPCVYPMLSVTVSLFGAQKETRTRRVFLNASVYVFGIATMYSILGVAAAFSGGLFGGVLQSPWALITIGALLFGLALSMFGLYELQMPYWLMSRLGGTTTAGTIGIYLSGLVVGVFAAPCIGPPIIALLAFVGSKGDPVFGFWSFFVLSLGLGAPYLVLGTFSNLLTKIPKSGAWMVWVKKVFGVVMVGAALFYVGLVLFPKQTVYVVPVTLLIGGMYLGFLESSGKNNPEATGLRRIQLIFGAASILLSVVSLQALQKPAIKWRPYTPEKLAEAIAAKKPVMMDFYADWCIPCLELDRLTFTDETMIEATDDFVKLKVDLTHFNSADSETLRRSFNVSGVPTIVFLGPDGYETPDTRVVGYLKPEEFIKRMQPVLSLAEVRLSETESNP